jgi:alpha-glucosidase
VWKNPKKGNQPPNNWVSTFGGSAWQLVPARDQFYYHYFYPQQPDLNWRNPKVAQTMYDTTRWWYKRGVVGFRLDAVDTLFEDPNLTDNPIKPGKNAYGDPEMEDKYNKKLPEVHQVMKGLRTAANEYNAVLIGETWTTNVSELKDYYGQNHDELQMPMDLMFTELKPLSADVFRKHIGAVYSSGEWPVWVMSNHDIRRAFSRAR